MASKASCLQPFRTSLDDEISYIEENLASITTAILHSHTSKDSNSYDIIRAHCHPGLQTQNDLLEPIASTTGLEAHLANMDALKKSVPELNVKSYNYSPSISEDKRRATVWFTTPGSDLPGDWLTNRESVHTAFWRRRATDGVWEMYKMCAIRGPGTLFPQAGDWSS
jgi:hypothetical protein